MRDTVLLCWWTLRAISVTPRTGSSIEKASSTCNPLSSTDADARDSSCPSLSSLATAFLSTVVGGDGEVGTVPSGTAAP